MEFRKGQTETGNKCIRSIRIFFVVIFLASQSASKSAVATTVPDLNVSENLSIWNFTSSNANRFPFFHTSRRIKRHSPTADSGDNHEHKHPKADCGFECDDGACISAHKVCDNYVHCKDASDEQQCTCKDRVGLNKHCDGIYDCQNGEDELGCGCQDTEFSCNDGHGEIKQKCISKSMQCDGVWDCDNHNDETNCFRVHTFDTIRGVLSEGYLQKRIGDKWYTLCKDSKAEKLITYYATKACRSIVGDTDDDVPKISQQKWSAKDAKENTDGFALFGDNEGKFTTQLAICQTHTVFKVTCPDPKCGWPASKFDKSTHVGRIRSRRSVEFDSDNDFNDLTAKIVGGFESKSGDWPFIIGIYKNGTFHCGGMIIHKDWILTAAHCFHKYENYAYEVQAGMLRRFSWSPYEQTRQVVQVYMHEKYDSKIFFNDITLLKLDAPFYLSKYVATACLAPPDKSLEPRAGQMCSVIGWGDLAETTRGPDHMQQVDLPVLSKCQETFTKDQVQICAGFVAGKKDACQGDSGGPFICFDDIGRYILNGLVSFGRGCARPKQPGVYTRISSYIEWIESVVNGENKILKNQKRPLLFNGGRCLKSGGENLYSKYVCNRQVECIDGSDELNCDYQGDFEDSLGVDERAYFDVELAVHGDLEHVHEFGTAKLCGPTEFQCLHTKSCVPIKMKCNGNYDCKDGTDERGCECKTIMENIYPDKVCDGINDCLDGSDEMDCEGIQDYVKCPFSKIWIPIRWWCDGMKHCSDGEDETDCMRLLRSQESIILEGYLSDKLSRGLQSGYAVLRSATTKWSLACEEERGNYFADLVCPYLGYRLKGDTTVVWSRSTRTAKFFSPLTLQVVNLTARASENSDTQVQPCTHLKVVCGEAHCGERRLYTYTDRNPAADEPGAQPWFVLVAVEGSPVCPATLVHKNWAIASRKCILEHVRSLNHEYVTVISGFTEKTPIVASPLEQMKRVNGIERLNGEFTLLHLDTPIMSDHFAAPICTEIGDDIEIDDMAAGDCTLISYNHDNYKIYGQKIYIDTKTSEKGKHFSIQLNNTQCEEIENFFVYCTIDWTTYTYLGSNATIDLKSCKEEGHVVLENPFYGVHEVESEEILTSPPSTTYKPPTCPGVRCSIGNCVEKVKVCDSIYQCSDGQDERRCQRHYLGIKSSGDSDEDEELEFSALNSSTSLKEPSCPVGHFRCKTTGNCVPISVFCDMVNDCGPDDFSDEPIDQSQCSCRHYLEMAAPERVCDSEIHCPDRSDELECPCHSASFFCDSPRESIPNECINTTFICDGHADCKSGIDEIGCINVSKNLNNLEPDIKDGSIEGYAFVRIKGIWHPYCSNEWSKRMGQKICKYIGYAILQSLNLFSLNELNAKESDLENKTSLIVAVRDNSASESEAFKTLDLIDSIDDPWSACQVGHLRCKRASSN